MDRERSKMVYWWWMCFGCLLVMSLMTLVGLEVGGTGVHDHEHDHEEAAAAAGDHSRTWRRNSSTTISDEVITYNGRSLIINGQPKILFSGSIHYPRSTPQMWPDLIAKAKEGGIDVIQTYVFWNQHEPQPDQYDFGGRNDIVRFIKEIKAQGLYACLRIGPFIEGEWTYGGLPFWLHDVPGIVYRSDNEPFKHYMQKFTTKIVNLMKSEGLYASQGGPIILSQIENEYRNVEAAFHEKGPPYVQWAAKMAVGLQTGVPWVMCKQDDAPDPVINACNGMNCGETFAGPNSPNKPAIWTENWTSFYQVFGGEPYIRSAEDIAFAVALFLAKNGSYVNYYMYHGGTNFGRTGSEYMTTGYYDQAPLDEYGLIRQPKWGHLKELHSAIKLYSEILLSGTYTNFSLGPLQDAYIFKKSSGECVAFLSNRDKTHTATVQYQNSSYELPRRSISILSDCKNVVFNTAKVSTQYNTRSVGSRKIITSPEKWQGFKDTTPIYEETSLRANILLEHMNTTKDASDYLWYTFSFEYKNTGGHPALHVDSLGHVLHAFVNEKYVGYAHGNHDNKGSILEYPVSLNDGINHISLLSVMVGLPDSGAYLERRVTGLRKVYIQDNNGSQVFTNYAWGYQVGLTGEHLKIYADEGTSKVQWSGIANSTHQPLTWYKTTFDAPMGNDPVVLDLTTMSKGEAWVNGQSIGRYWVSFKSSKGNPSQTLYHVPREFLKPTRNLLVILEEINGDPLQISLGTISISKVCGHVSYDNLHSVNSWQEINNTDVGRSKKHNGGRPNVQLECPQGKKISHILFASLGTPLGNCNKYATGSCHSSNSKKVIEKACLGKRRCAIPKMINSFGADPCPGIPKSLLVDAECS